MSMFDALGPAGAIDAARLLAGAADAEAKTARAAPLAQAKEFDARQARAVSRDFEAVFLRQLIRAMRATAGETVLGKDAGSRMFRSMFDDALADHLAAGGGTGLGELIYRSLEAHARGAGALPPQLREAVQPPLPLDPPAACLPLRGHEPKPWSGDDPLDPSAPPRPRPLATPSEELP